MRTTFWDAGLALFEDVRLQLMMIELYMIKAPFSALSNLNDHSTSLQLLRPREVKSTLPLIEGAKLL